jgi:integrase
MSPCVAGKTRYSVDGGKIVNPLTKAEFEKGIATGKFCQKNHKAFAVMLWYAGLRKTELRLAKKEQFQIQGEVLVFDVGKRLKHSKETEPLQFPLMADHIDLVLEAIKCTRPGERVFGFSDRTAYNIIRRVWHYPHHLRLTRITREFEKGHTVPEVKSFTGLTLTALDSYIGKVTIANIGKGFIDEK